MPLAFCFTNHARRRAPEVRLAKTGFVIASIELALLAGMILLSLVG